MSHVIRRRAWDMTTRRLDPLCSLDWGPPPTCDVCNGPFLSGCFGSPRPADGLCTDCRKAVQDAREQRVYLASLSWRRVA
jgi:hypothetical protein